MLKLHGGRTSGTGADGATGDTAMAGGGWQAVGTPRRRAAMSHLDTLSGVSVPLGPAQQCQGGTWTPVLYSSDTHRDSTGGRDSSNSAHSQRLPHATPGFRAGITAKRHKMQQVFWAIKRAKGSRHELHCAHTKPQLDNTAVSCKTSHMCSQMLPRSHLPPCLLTPSQPHNPPLYQEQRAIYFFPPFG